MTEHADIFRAIAAPIPPEQVRQRSESGRRFDYITARTVMNRLDSVIGPECWWDSYEILETREIPGARPTWVVTVRCKLSVQVAGACITKEGIGSDKHQDLTIAMMAGESTALKRAGVKFGIGRELYGDGVASYDDGPEADDAAAPQASKPTSAPQHKPAPQAPAPVMVPPSAPGNAKQYGPPQSGKALYAWARDNNQFEVIKNWGLVENYPARVVDWSAEQVAIFWEHNCAGA